MLPALEPDITEGSRFCSHRLAGHPNMEQAQGRTAGKHQATLPESLAGGFKEIELVFQAEFLEVASRYR